MRWKYLFIFFVGVIFFSRVIFAQEDSLLPLQGIAKKNGVKLSNGDILVEIYDAPTSGNLLYTSTNDFLNVTSGGEYDIILGNGSQPLSLNYGQRYYMDISLNGVDMDFNGSERKVFMSNVGNISMTTPLRTNSTDTDDALNISRGGAFIGGNTVFNNFFNITTTTSAVRTNGTITVLSTLSPALSINGFNVSGSNAALSTNGTVTILSLLSPALSIQGFNVSGSNAALSTNGTVTILSLLSPALSINGFNVSGASAALSTNGTVTMGSTAVIQSTDADDALNVSNGGGNFRGQLGVQNYTSAPAFTVNYGFNISGASSALTTNGTVTILSLLSPALSIQGFNVSGSNAALSTNGTVTILSNDTDDALNVSSGSVFIRGGSAVANGYALSVNRTFNLTASGNTQIGGTLDADGGVDLGGGATSIVTITSPNGPTNVAVGEFYVDGSGSTNVSSSGIITLGINGEIRLGKRLNLSANGDPRWISADNVFNVTLAGGIEATGGLSVDGATDFNRFFNITPATSAVRTNGTVTILSLLSPALSINGFNVSGASAALSTNGSILVNNLFNVTASNGNTDIGGTLDVDGAVTLNSRASPAFSVNSGFNISGADSALRTNGTVTITNSAVNDALNLTSGGLSALGNVIVGNAESTVRNQVVIYDGGTDKCSLLVLFDETGADYFIYVNATNGFLSISNSSPTTCDEGQVVGRQT